MESKRNIMDTKITLPKAMAGIVGSLTSAFAGVPEAIQEFMIAFMALLALDFFTGFAVAHVARSVNEFTMRTKLFAKLAQYVGLLGCAWVFQLISHSWVPVHTVMAGLCAIELTSILENVTRLQQFGRNLGPLSGFFDRIRPYLAIADKPIVLTTQDATQTQQQVQAPTVVINPQSADIAVVVKSTEQEDADKIAESLDKGKKRKPLDELKTEFKDEKSPSDALNPWG